MFARNISRYQHSRLLAGLNARLQSSSLSSTSASTTGTTPSFAIVGTGPAGFYTAKYLLKAMDNVKIDMIDALPTPFGKRIEFLSAIACLAVLSRE